MFVNQVQSTTLPLVWHITLVYTWLCKLQHDKHQWLLLQFIVLLKMDAKGVRNMLSILVVFNKHNTARVASSWFIIYYIIVFFPLFRLQLHHSESQRQNAPHKCNCLPDQTVPRTCVHFGNRSLLSNIWQSWVVFGMRCGRSRTKLRSQDCAPWQAFVLRQSPRANAKTAFFLAPSSNS